MSPIAPFLAPDRDEAFVRARPKSGGGTTYYGLPEPQVGAPSQQGLTINQDNYAPLLVRTPFVFDLIATEVTVSEAGDTFRVGLYRSDRNMQPIGAPVFDSGTLSTASVAVVTYTPSTPVFVPRGRYLGVVNTSATAAAIRTWRPGSPGADNATPANGLNWFTVGRTYAAFPTPGTAWTTVVGSSTAGVFFPYLFRMSAP